MRVVVWRRESYTPPAALLIMASPSSFTYYCPPSSSPVWSEPLYSLRPEHARERLQDDSVETVTSIEQVRWPDWARRPRGGFWERESRPQGRRRAELTGELLLPQCTAAPPLWEALGAQAWLGWGMKRLWGQVGEGSFSGLDLEGRTVPGSSLPKEAERIVFCAWRTEAARAGQTASFILPGHWEVFRWVVLFPHPARSFGT